MNRMSEKAAKNPIPDQPPKAPEAKSAETPTPSKEDVKEIGGPRGPEPTRYNDWERNGRCSDF
jgi:hypothetical protein